MDIFNLNIFGIDIRVSSGTDFASENLKKDFAFYLDAKETPGVINIKIHREGPPYQCVPLLEASLYNLGSICYRDKGVHYVDYSGKGLMIYNFDTETANIYSEDENLLYEKARLAILSRIGELADRRHIHRVHAAGFTKDGQATMCLLPMEAGKTTLTLNVLKRDTDIKLLSDDVCFIDSRGQIYPFPLRIGVRSRDFIKEIPEAYITRINRITYGEKFLIDLTYFRGRIAEKNKLSNILIGKRVFQENSEIRKISKLKCFIPFIQSGVFGLGLPQIAELFLRSGLLEVIEKIRIIFSRSLLFLSVIYKADAYEFRIGRDLDVSTAVLASFINEKIDKKCS